MNFKNWTDRLVPHGGNILSAVLGQGLAIVGIAVGSRILTEQASPATFGKAKLLIGLVTLVIGVLVRPFSQFAMRQYHDEERSNSGNRFHLFARRSQRILLLISGSLLGAGIFLYQTWDGASSWVIPFAVFGMLLLQGMVEIERSMMVTRNRQAAVSVLQVGQQWGLPMLTAMILFLTSDSVEVFLSAQVVVWGLLLLVAYSLSGPVKKKAALECRESGAKERLARSWIRQARAFVVPMLGLGLFQWIVSIGDRYIMAGYVDMAEVGKYSAVYGLISAPFLAFIALLARLAQPFFYRAAAAGNERRSGRLKWGMLGFASIVSLIATASAWLFGDFAGKILLAEEYRQGIRPLMVWLAAGYGLLAISTSFETEAFARKKTLILTMAYGVAAAVNIVFNLSLIPKVGILGAAQATCVTFAVYLLILAGFDLRRKPDPAVDRSV